MNVVFLEENPIAACLCGCSEKNSQKIAYTFFEGFHRLCMDKKYIIQAEIEACERLLKYVINNRERTVIEKELSELKSALDLML